MLQFIERLLGCAYLIGYLECAYLIGYLECAYLIGYLECAYLIGYLECAYLIGGFSVGGLKILFVEIERDSFGFIVRLVAHLMKVM